MDPTAEKTVNEIADYLRKEWTDKELNAFFDDIDGIINAIEIYPKLFKPSTKRKNVHLALISKHTFLIYQVKTQ